MLVRQALAIMGSQRGASGAMAVDDGPAQDDICRGQSNLNSGIGRSQRRTDSKLILDGCLARTQRDASIALVRSGLLLVLSPGSMRCGNVAGFARALIDTAYL